MNWLQLPPEDRPRFPTRDLGDGAVEVRCPACNQWRAGFLLEALAPADAVTFGAEWGCDIERSQVSRAAEAAARAETPPAPRRVLTPFEHYLLWLPIEVVAMAGSANPMMVYAYETAKQAPFIDLDDGNVIAGRMLALQDGIIDQARFDRISAGLPPEDPA